MKMMKMKKIIDKDIEIITTTMKMMMKITAMMTMMMILITMIAIMIIVAMKKMKTKEESFVSVSAHFLVPCASKMFAKIVLMDTSLMMISNAFQNNAILTATFVFEALTTTIPLMQSTVFNVVLNIVTPVMRMDAIVVWMDTT